MFSPDAVVVLDTKASGSFGTIRLVKLKVCANNCDCVGCRECLAAAKTTTNPFYDDEEYDSVNSFKDEVESMSKLDHPNIIKYFSSDRKTLTIYMEPFFHTNLINIYPKPRLEKVKRLMGQLLSGLQHMHDRDIAHLDIKPDNLLVDEWGTLKICDFGGSQQMCDGVCTLRQSTFQIAPPDHAYGVIKQANGIRFDLWSTAVVLIYMLLNRYPWESAKYFNNDYNDWKTKTDKSSARREMREISPEMLNVVDKMFDNYLSWGSLECKDFINYFS